MADEMEDQDKVPAGMVKTETGRLITKAADNAWRTKQAAAMTEQRRRMLLRGMKATTSEAAGPDAPAPKIYQAPPPITPAEYKKRFPSK
jgi:hypothetical protein